MTKDPQLDQALARLRAAQQDRGGALGVIRVKDQDLRRLLSAYDALTRPKKSDTKLDISLD
jgi:hypothetical protein